MNASQTSGRSAQVPDIVQVQVDFAKLGFSQHMHGFKQSLKKQKVFAEALEMQIKRLSEQQEGQAEQLKVMTESSVSDRLDLAINARLKPVNVST